MGEGNFKKNLRRKKTKDGCGKDDKTKNYMSYLTSYIYIKQYKAKGCNG